MLWPLVPESHCSAAQLPPSESGFSALANASLRVRVWSTVFIAEPPPPDLLGTPNLKFFSLVMLPDPSTPARPPENSELVAPGHPRNAPIALRRAGSTRGAR